jgi:hypothetical protein
MLPTSCLAISLLSAEPVLEGHLMSLPEFNLLHYKVQTCCQKMKITITKMHFNAI